MTDEEMAYKHAEEYVEHWIVGEDDNALMQEAYKDGFLDGLKESRKQWHDLRKANNSQKEGAEFGYNKANEWHYIKDGDYPKEKGNYLVAWKRTHHVEEYGKWGFDVDLFNADEGYFEGVGDYVIAWKEIVLPKESE